jgi:uncharacterized protein YdaT
MPYTKKDYPSSMKNLTSEIRNKAIDILNALIQEGKMEIGNAIPTAISRAKDWAANRNKHVPPSPTDNKKHGEDLHVLPRKKGWAIKKEKAERASSVFEKKNEAVSSAREIAKKNNGSLIVHRKTGTIQSKISYTQ